MAEYEHTVATPDLRLSPDGRGALVSHGKARELYVRHDVPELNMAEVEGWARLVPAPATVDRDAVARWIMRYTMDIHEDDHDWESACDMADELLAYVRENAAPAVPAADDQVPDGEDLLHRMAEAMMLASEEAVAISLHGTWSEWTWREMARAARDVLREVSS